MEYIASEYRVDLPVFQSPMEKYKILFCTQNDQYYIFDVPIFLIKPIILPISEKRVVVLHLDYVKVAFPQIIFLKQLNEFESNVLPSSIYVG